MIKKSFTILYLLISINGLLLANTYNDEIMCKDLDPDCPSRKIFCDHEAYRAVMILKCAKTCDACDEVNKMIEEMEIEEENENKQLPWTHGGGSTEKEVDEENNEENENGNEETETPVKEVEEVLENTEEPESPIIENNVDEEQVEEEGKKVEEEDISTENVLENNKELEITPQEEEEEEEEVEEMPEIQQIVTVKPKPYTQFNKYKPMPERVLTTQSKSTTNTKTQKPKPKASNVLMKRIENENKRRCVDDASDCALRKNLCNDIKYGVIVKKVCKRTCNVCQPAVVPSNAYKTIASKSRNKVKSTDFYLRWKESRNTTPKPVIITMQHMRNQTRNNNKNTFGKKTITKKVTSQTLPRNKNPYPGILSGRYGSRRIEETIETSTSGAITDKAIDCVSKQALCNHKGYKNLMERMCPQTCSKAFSYYSFNQ